MAFFFLFLAPQMSKALYRAVRKALMTGGSKRRGTDVTLTLPGVRRTIRREAAEKSEVIKAMLANDDGDLTVPMNHGINKESGYSNPQETLEDLVSIMESLTDSPDDPTTFNGLNSPRRRVDVLKAMHYMNVPIPDYFKATDVTGEHYVMTVPADLLRQLTLDCGKCDTYSEPANKICRQNCTHLSLRYPFTEGHPRLQELPELQQQHILKYLDVSYHRLSRLPPMDGFTNLQHLYVKMNQLTQLPSMSELKNLRHLDVSHNDLTQLPSMDGLTNLRHLDVSMNQLSQLPSLEHLANTLEHLNVDGNMLEALPRWIGNLQNLKHLEIGLNRNDAFRDDYEDKPPGLDTNRICINGSAVIDTKPANAPFSIIIISVLPPNILVITAPAIQPPHAAS